jgi:hypothetical protein
VIWYEKVLPMVPLALEPLVITGGDAIAVPVPERKIMIVRSRKSLPVMTDMLPLVEPIPRGANVTDKLALCSGPKVIGNVGPLKLNPVPETDACEMVIDRLLVLVTEVERVLLLPCWTLPKLRPEEAILCCPEAALAHKMTLRRSRCHQTRLPSKPQRRISPTLSLRAQTAHGGELWSRCQRDADYQAFQQSATARYSVAIVCRSGESQ